MARKKVVVTGACGYVAQRMWDELTERYDIVALDVYTATRDGVEVPGVQTCDLTDSDRDRYREHFAGADAVVHCAFVNAEGLDATTFMDTSGQGIGRIKHINYYE